MADVNVVVTLGLQPELVERIRTVDLGVRVTVLSPVQRRLRVMLPPLFWQHYS